MNKFNFFFLFILLSLSLFPLQARAAAVNIAKNTIRETRVEIDLKNFAILYQHPDLRARFIPESLRWERNQENLLSPKVLLGLAFKKNGKSIHIEHLGEKYIPVTKGIGVYSELWVDLFNPGEIQIIEENSLSATVRIESVSNLTVKKTQLIDYSCSPYQISVTGLENEYASVGCLMNRVGPWGKETPRLEVTLITTNYRMPNGAFPPYKIILEDQSPAEFILINSKGEKRPITIKGVLPKRLNRVKLAVGFGPYEFSAHNGAESKSGELAPSLMLYGKLDLTDTSSLKFFDAALIQKTFFNNMGLYFSYDLAEVFDGRIIFNTLLGFQGLNFKYSADSVANSRMIYPQGFEVLWKHPFNQENYYLTYGMFLSTDNTEDYTNAWLRYGKSYFWEVNYIRWKYLESDISMWGLSIGLPLTSFF